MEIFTGAIENINQLGFNNIEDVALFYIISKLDADSPELNDNVKTDANSHFLLDTWVKPKINLIEELNQLIKFDYLQDVFNNCVSLIKSLSLEIGEDNIIIFYNKVADIYNKLPQSLNIDGNEIDIKKQFIDKVYSFINSLNS